MEVRTDGGPPVAGTDGRRPVARALRAALERARADTLLRSSTLLVIDYLAIGAIGGICSVIAARCWPAYDVGTVAALTGVITVLSTLTSNGLASTITRFLAASENQLDFILEALILTVVTGVAVSAAVCFVPGHFGVPLRDLPASTFIAFLLVGGYVATNNMTSVTDPAFIARKEVSYAVVKDITAAVLRIPIMILSIGTHAVGLLRAAVLYVALSGLLDIGLVGWRLRNRGAGYTPLLRFAQLRARWRFALSSQGAAMVSVVPTALLATIAAAFDGPVTAAEITIPLTVAAYVTVIPSMTSQALLADLSDPDRDAAVIGLGALRLCYAGTLPAALVLGLGAHWILLIFGHRYAGHSVGYLRWDAAATLVSTSNYVTDTVLLARERIVAYNVVNVLGAASVLACIFAAALLGRYWFGPAMAAGQLLYLLWSVIAVLRYAPPSRIAAAVRGLSWSLS